MPITCLIVGAVFFAIFVAHQVFWKKGQSQIRFCVLSLAMTLRFRLIDGVFHHDLFGNRNFAMAAFAVAVEGWFLIT